MNTYMLYAYTVPYMHTLYLMLLQQDTLGLWHCQQIELE